MPHPRLLREHWCAMALVWLVMGRSERQDMISSLAKHPAKLAKFGKKPWRGSLSKSLLPVLQISLNALE